MHGDRCGTATHVTILSMCNTDTICLACKDAETKRPDVEQARTAEEAACRSGHDHFKGIGWRR